MMDASHQTLGSWGMSPEVARSRRHGTPQEPELGLLQVPLKVQVILKLLLGWLKGVKSEQQSSCLGLAAMHAASQVRQPALNQVTNHVEEDLLEFECISEH